MRTPMLAIIGIVIIASGCQMTPKELSQADIAEIRKLEQEFLKAIVASDFDKAVALRTEDVIWMPPGAPTLEGRAALLQSLSSSPVRPLNFTANPIQTDGLDGLAYNRGEYTYVGIVGKDTLRESGKYLQIWKKQPDASWLIALDIWNANPAN